ncbi:hypothetical protein [Fodinicola feengrottensis]|uniref:hypothetical protein n=1 Tax=Fodinicola feengrottensis TaxID=435914 RepID=UPI0013D20B3B|nr:hypothetical protein [Fodinicola feengrottensis]
MLGVECGTMSRSRRRVRDIVPQSMKLHDRGTLTKISYETSKIPTSPCFSTEPSTEPHRVRAPAVAVPGSSCSAPGDGQRATVPPAAAS